jgi:hypothetical protein
MRHNGHQAGEFVTELAIHATRLTRCRARGPPSPPYPGPPRPVEPSMAGSVTPGGWAAAGTDCTTRSTRKIGTALSKKLL